MRTCAHIRWVRVGRDVEAGTTRVTVRADIPTAVYAAQSGLEPQPGLGVVRVMQTYLYPVLYEITNVFCPACPGERPRGVA